MFPHFGGSSVAAGFHLKRIELALEKAVGDQHFAARRASAELVDEVRHAFREVHADHALQHAKRIDDLLAAGEDPGALAGVPIAIKDNIVSEVGTSACGSRFLESYRSPFTATAVRRLVSAGAVIVGRTNCDEFAMGSSTEHCAFGAARNPHDHSRVPGGSSGGASALTAAGITAERDVEVRRVMLERYGAERYLRESQAAPVQRDARGELWRAELADDEPLVMVRVVNRTPEPDGSHREYWLRVPPTMQTAREAVAWTFGKRPASYAPLRET